MTTNREQRGFEDLECYQLALQVLKEAYQAAERLPADEKFNLVSQMRRAGTSVVLNIAEGYGRYHFLDSLRFYYMARGSLNEVLSGFIAIDALGYSQNELARQRELCHSALRSLNGYIRYVQKQQQGMKEYGNQYLREGQPIYFISTDFSTDPD